MAKNKDNFELRLREVPKVMRTKVNNYRNIMQSMDGGKKPDFKAALIELVDYGYKELSVKRIEDD